MWIFQFTGQPALGEYTEEIKEYCEKHLSDNTLALYIKKTRMKKYVL